MLKRPELFFPGFSFPAEFGGFVSVLAARGHREHLSSAGTASAARGLLLQGEDGDGLSDVLQQAGTAVMAPVSPELHPAQTPSRSFCPLCHSCGFSLFSPYIDIGRN